jgi:hypothetical protein
MYANDWSEDNGHVVVRVRVDKDTPDGVASRLWSASGVQRVSTEAGGVSYKEFVVTFHKPFTGDSGVRSILNPHLEGDWRSHPTSLF